MVQKQLLQRDSVQQQGRSEITYRQQRRITQGQRQNGKRTRGPTRGIKWRDERSNRGGSNPSCSITRDMKRIVGENANQFITEVSSMVKSLLPLNCRGWRSMEYDTRERLLTKIKGDWKFPEGEDIDRIVEQQCQELYRNRRYRLKENYFNGFTIAEAIGNCPSDVDKDQWEWLVQRYWGTEKAMRISEANRRNRFKQKVKGNQGSKSTARILDTMRKLRGGTASQSSEHVTQNSEDGTQPSQGTVVGSNEVQPPPEPEYIRLWILTKRHKDNSWDKAAEDRLEDFKALHKQQLELHGVDNLTVQEAYMKVLGTSSGYINGLGFGPKPPKRSAEGGSGGGGIEIAHQMAEQMEQMERQSREREAVLKAQVEKDSMEIERLKEDKDEMQGEFEKLKRETEEREARMRADLRAMQEKLTAFFAVNPQT